MTRRRIAILGAVAGSFFIAFGVGHEWSTNERPLWLDLLTLVGMVLFLAIFIPTVEWISRNLKKDGEK